MGLLYFIFSFFNNHAECPDRFCMGSTLSAEYFYPLHALKWHSDYHQFRTVRHHTIDGNRLSNRTHHTSKPSNNLDFIVIFTTGTVNNEISQLLDQMFIPYKIITIDKAVTSSVLDMLDLSDDDADRSRPGLIFFHEFAIYLHLPENLRSVIDRYCHTYGVGVIAFINEGEAFSTEPTSLTKLGNLPLFIHRLSDSPWGLYTAHDTNVLRVTRKGRLQPGFLDYQDGVPRCCRATLVPVPGSDRYFVPVMFTRIGKQPVDKISPVLLTTNHTCVLNSKGTDFVYQSLVLEDLGYHDGVRRILFSTTPDGLWINKLLLFDSLVHLSNGRIHAASPVGVPLGTTHQHLVQSSISDIRLNDSDLVRWILIDVDDVFLHGSGVSFTVQDAAALITAQQHWRNHIPGFTFNLGFCGHFFEKASAADLSGYETILENRRKFWWFDHLWNHLQPHKLNLSTLLDLMRRNQRFAEEHDIPLEYSYAVAPHHSGVYPVVPHLYEAWRQVWNLSCTSTAHYPRLLTTGPHLGFRYAGIQVLPRQTCGIYSRFIQIGDFPGGEERLRQLVFGGSVFYTLLYNPISIFMTHMTNYKGDRLALYLFDTLFQFIRDWTNLRLMSAPPTQLANLYRERFASFGAEDLPLYTDPCRDLHDLALWPSDWPCGPKALPSLLILGPQKTGSTALVHFLRLNPALRANRYQPGTTYEELQFFSSDRIYARGLHWYLTQLNSLSSSTLDTKLDAPLRFEKSATYFTSEKAPTRIHTLVPKVRLVVLLRNPVERAYSWYQHSLAHGDMAPQLISFIDLMRLGATLNSTQILQHASPSRLKHFNVIPSNLTSVQLAISAIRHLYNRCVEPGHYAKHLTRWLSYFSATQILPVDSTQFNHAPDTVLHVIQEFLRLPTRLNFSEYLEYNRLKGFYCLRDSFQFPSWPDSHLPPGRHCLGSGKGRPYPHLNYTTEILPLLRDLYLSANRKLFTLFQQQPVWRWWMSKASGREYPTWLLDSIVPG